MTISPESAFTTLPPTLRDDLLSAYKEIINNYRERRWEPSELNGGKLCEAAYTICKGWLEGGQYPPHAQKPSRFPNACLKLADIYQNVPNSRSARILIPRVLLGLYDIRNNRGVGHSGSIINPNHMDATLVLYSAKWIVAELVRLLHTLTPEDATALVESLVEREVDWIWSDGNKKRILKKGLTWKQKTLLLLLSETTKPVPERDLFQWLEHPNLASFRRDVLKPMHRDRLIEYDKNNKDVILLPPGVKVAEKLIA